MMQDSGQLKRKNNQKPMRLRLEQAIQYKGYRDLYEFAEACDEYAIRTGSDLTFSRNIIYNYMYNYTSMSVNRLMIVADLLNTPIEELHELFTPPEVRGCGDDWIGDRGSRARDYNMLRKRLIR